MAGFREFEQDRLKEQELQAAEESRLIQERRDMASLILDQKGRASIMKKPSELEKFNSEQYVKSAVNPNAVNATDIASKSFIAPGATANPVTQPDSKASQGGAGFASALGGGVGVANLAGASNTPGGGAGKVSAAPALTGAATGASVGAAGGPIGAVIGAVVGLTAGLLSESEQSKKQKKAAKAAAMNQYYENQSKVNQQLTEGTTNQFSQLMRSYGNIF